MAVRSGCLAWLSIADFGHAAGRASRKRSPRREELVCERASGAAERGPGFGGGSVPAGAASGAELGGGVCQSRGDRHAPEKLGRGAEEFEEGRTACAENGGGAVEHRIGRVPEGELCGGHCSVADGGARGARVGAGALSVGNVPGVYGPVLRGRGDAGTFIAGTLRRREVLVCFGDRGEQGGEQGAR